mmetsp:Transcript_5974/g.18760  ORF Transcript_5974/g.18760 Transcript_5974/m.18760 type:complete len:108 (+) Transcript_5974:4382-4705(+)
MKQLQRAQSPQLIGQIRIGTNVMENCGAFADHLMQSLSEESHMRLHVAERREAIFATYLANLAEIYFLGDGNTSRERRARKYTARGHLTAVRNNSGSKESACKAFTH